MNKEKVISVSFSIALFLIVVLSLSLSSASSSGTSSNASSRIYTTGTPSGQNQSFGIILGKTINDWNFKFFANFTNLSGTVLNSSIFNSSCAIRFNETGTFNNFVNMSYNASSLFWEFNRSFSYKGSLSYNIQCNSTFGNVSVNDSFSVLNTRPWINKSESTSIMNSVNCSEGNITSCTYNLTSTPYLFEDDFNDLRYINFTLGIDTTLTNYTFSNGLLIINKTGLSQNDNQDFYFSLKDSSGVGDGPAKLPINILEVNNAPTLDVINRSFNISSVFEYIIYGSDQENNLNFTFNISFLSCNVADWSSRNCSTLSGRTLFNSSQYSTNGSAINISFTPGKDDVGNYSINFTITDLNNQYTPYNASSSIVVNFSVLNINSAPYFRYACARENNATENSAYTCLINVSDTDEGTNLTLSSNYSWFLFNSSNSSVTTINVSLSTLFNGTALVNFTPRDAQVGNWSINLSLIDSLGKLNSSIIYINITNVNDSVSFNNNISNMSVATEIEEIFLINASDDDLLIPEKNVYNETLSISSDASWVSVSSQRVISATNITEFNISVTAPPSANGSIVNVTLTIRDANNFSIDSRIFYINVTEIEGNVVTPTSSGGGGGGGGRITVVKPASLKLILPEPVQANSSGSVTLPIAIQNNGQVNLTDITLSDIITLNGTLMSDVRSYFTLDKIPLLVPGQKVETRLIAEINLSVNGLYEITLNASVQNPKYSETGKVYINVKPDKLIEDKVKFTEELIINNEQCADIKPLLEEARTLYDKREFVSAESKLDRAISDCKQAIDQTQAVNKPAPPISKNIKLIGYLAVAVVLALVIGFAFYMFQQLKLKKLLDQTDFI